MRRKRQNKLGTAVAVACCAGAAGVALAADIPFWGGGSSMPTRTPASEAPSIAKAPLDSRAVQTAESAAVAFDVDAASGGVILIR